MRSAVRSAMSSRSTGRLASREANWRSRHQGVAVTADRVGTQAPLCRKIVLEELDEIAAECGLGRAAHGAPPSTRSPKARANRSPARATTAGMKRR